MRPGVNPSTRSRFTLYSFRIGRVRQNTHTVGGFMSQKLSALAVTFVALALVACGAGSIGAGNTALMNGTTYSLPAVDSDLAMIATLPKDTIGEELPEEGVGSIKSSVWKATLGGFTQTQRTQSLAFPPGTKITIRNLSSS